LGLSGLAAFSGVLDCALELGKTGKSVVSGSLIVIILILIILIVIIVASLWAALEGLTAIAITCD